VRTTTKRISFWRVLRQPLPTPGIFALANSLVAHACARRGLANVAPRRNCGNLHQVLLLNYR